jgi:hypothetical protein
MGSMSKATTSDRKASASEVRPHVARVRQFAREAGVSNPRLRGDGTVVVHSPHAGYREVIQLSQRLSAVVGCYVHVITDDVPAAEDAQPV